MNIAKILKNAVGAALSGILIFGFQSCKDNKVNETVDLGTVQGTVTDGQGLPLTDVLVSVSGSELTALTAVDGTYVISDVPMQKQSIIFTKDGFAQVSASVNSSNFKDRVAQLDVVMIMSGGVIRGKCINSSGEPYSGVEVSLNDGAARTTTGSDGIYEFGNLTIDNYTLVFRMTDCADVKRTVSSEQFTSELGYVVELSDVVMGAKQVLRGQTAEDLSHADIWHYNEYRGGKNGDDYPHFDWSSDFLCTLTGFWGNWEEQNEGTTLQIRNNESEGDWANPVDLEVFDSYLAGRKLITEDNCKMYLKVRTHNATEEDKLPFGVQVVDLAEADPTAVLIGGIREHGSDRYSNPDYEFDLSPYIGKEVVIAIGIFRAKTGDWYKQLVIRRIAFAKEAPSEWGYLPGEQVPGLDEGYKMTMEMVRSTMPVTEFSEFTGISPVGPTDIDGPEKYRDAYKTWRPIGHFAAWWSCMPVKKDAEPFATEGFVIKTNGGGTPVSLDSPQSYFYAKFAVASGHNQLVLNCRTFSAVNATYLKLTAITEDGTVKHMQPITHEADNAEAAASGAWKLIHESGSNDTPEDYAKFVYDLSEFNGKNVVVALGVFKGEDNGDENKLAIYKITIE